MSAPAPGGGTDPAVLMHSILKRIATGPELSKDLSQEEACAGMRCVLEGRVDPVQAGVFLIALRMKRETDDENRGLLDAIREATLRVTAPVDEVVDIGDPYDGCNRTLPAAPFLPAVLAACGVAAVSHGVQRMGPKYGVTHRQAGGAVARGGCRASRRPRRRLVLRRSGGVLPAAACARRAAQADRQATRDHYGRSARRPGARARQDAPGHRLRAQTLSTHLRPARAPRRF